MVEFQFQTGSIKSPDLASLGMSLYICFNSKLVRLKASVYNQRLQRVYRFNSKLVRLKVTTSWNANVAIKFQFQTGSIKRLLLNTKSRLNSGCFNSKLVRLKGFPNTALIL